MLCCIYVVRKLTSATPCACVLVGGGLDTVLPHPPPPPPASYPKGGMGGNFSNETNFGSECEAAPPATR